MPIAHATDGTALHNTVTDFTDPWTTPDVLVLQHGFARNGRFWYGMVPALARHYRVVCPDLRGLGASGTDFDGDRVTLDTYLDDLVRVIEHTDTARIHFAGESFGGMLGVHLATRHRERVKSLTAIAVPPVPVMHAPESYPLFGHASWAEALRTMGAEAWCRAANAATRFPPDAEPGLVEWYASEGAACNLDALIALARVIQAVDLTPLLEQISVPVLGLYPTLAKTVTDRQMELLHRIPDLRVVHLPIADHMIWALEPDACTRHMLEFLQGSDAH